MGLADIATKALDFLSNPRLGLIQLQLEWLYRALFPYIAQDFVNWADHAIAEGKRMAVFQGHIHPVLEVPGETLFPEVPWPVNLQPETVGTMIMPTIAGLNPMPIRGRVPVVPTPPIGAGTGNASDALQPFDIENVPSIPF